jgi:hypothetical protein
VKNNEKITDDPNSLLQTSSSGPPNKNFFQFYKIITIDHNQVSGTWSHKNFPVLISLLDSDLHDDVQSNGNDIAFANDTAWLDHEIEIFTQSYNDTHAQLIAWVRIPNLYTSIDTVIRMYYGNSTMGSQENPDAVWDSNFKGVWHLSEDPSGSSPQMEDSTLNNNNGAVNNLQANDQVNGQIDGSIDFDATTDYINCTDDSSLNVGSSDFSLSLWFNFDGGTIGIIAGKGAILGGIRYCIWIDTPAGLIRGEIDDNNPSNKYILSSSTYGDNAWHHIALIRDGTYLRMYIDGEESNSAVNITGYGSLDNTFPFYMNTLANDNGGSITTFSSVKLDEVRVSTVARSADWIATEYNNQNNTDSFYFISSAKQTLSKYDFNYYKEIIIDHNKVSGSGDLLNFPVLISIIDSDLKKHTQQEGNDIAFYDGTKWLDHEIEIFNQSYDVSHAQLVAWIRIPTLYHDKDTIFYMYYGNSTMTSRENPEGVWDDDYEFVLHMNQDPSSSNISDSTANGFDFDVEALGSMTSEDLVYGQTGKAIAFDGVDDYIYLPTTEGFTGPTDKFTFEFWLMFPDGWSPASRVYLGAPATSDAKPRLTFYQTFEWLIETTSDTRTLDSTTTNFNAGTWYQFTTVWDGTGAGLQRIYISGSLENDDSSPRIGTHISWNTFSIGAEDDYSNGPGGSGSDNQIKATISEFRLSKVVRTAEWIATEFNNQDDPTSFYSIGKEYTTSGIPPNEKYFKFNKEIIIDHAMISGSHDLYNFPLLISIIDDDLHDKAQMDGDDIAFSYNGAWLDHEIELYNQTYSSSQAQLVAWVSIPRISPSLNTSIRMYYGNATMSSRQNPNGVWINNYIGVWHLSESTGSALDSTSYSTSGTVSGTVSRGATGKADGAYDFGNNGQIDFGDPSDGHFDMGTGSFTISFWINVDQSISWYQLPLYKGATTQYDVGYDFETDQDATALSFRICDDSENLGESPFMDIDLDTWMYVTGIVDRTLDRIHIFKNGLQVGSGGNIASVGNINNANHLYISAAVGSWEIDGIMDEIRICNVQRSAGWIATEYSNQYNPQAFITIGSEESFDYTAPTYSNLIESSDPLELGAKEVITINVSDPSGINQVKIAFGGSNHSMTNIGGDSWQYDSWTPSSVGNYTYTIWMEDNYNNWNSTIGTIEVIDTTPPTYSDLIESADPLQVGQNETISIKVYDSPGSGVNQVLLEYGLVPTNHSMVQDGNTWSWSKWKPALGLHSYTIWMEDNCNNWNSTSGTIEAVETTGPIIENITKSEDPLELGNIITIFVDVFDNETSVSTVLIELDNINYTMSYVDGNTYEYNWTRSWVGLVRYVIYANDSLDNWNSYSGSFDIVDTTPPLIGNLSVSENPLELGDTVSITVNCTDLSSINIAKIEYLSSNHTMLNITGEIWQYNIWTPETTGNLNYIIWVEDNNNNWGSISNWILVQDTTPPIYSNLTESAKIVELGEQLTISINATDLADIKSVSIEYETSNHPMTNIGGDIWQYNSWVPTSIGNYNYTIYITDNNDNLNYVESSILFQDTTLPVYSNLFESADPLELGDNPIIRIDVHDFAGINQTFIEFEGANHSMTNIYGYTWQFDSWTPNNWICYQYIIHMEDRSGNWNSIVTNITVEDTTPPSQPLFAISPSGEVSGIITFDWLDGIDPSGISYYILIISNETDPLATSGYIYFFNITNVGQESSYCELPEVLSPGKYYFFLAQVDGVGQQGDYTIGTFTVISGGNGSPDNMLLIIIIILASAIASITAIVIVRKKLKKEIIPARKKISLKTISSHINRLSSVDFTVQPEKIQDITDEKEQEINIDEIKSLGEELFAEGAYLEAQKQFKKGRDLLINLGREEEAKLLSELISGIEGLINEREKRLEILEQAKLEDNAAQVFDIYHEIIAISKKLRDPDTASFYQSELIQFFQTNKLKLVNLEVYRSILEEKADSLLNSNQLENAAQLYGKCEKISRLFVQLEKDGEVENIEKFKNKKAECLDKIT